MSLISDPDYLIHNLRLTYLRHLEDPYGPRIIRTGPRYLNNPHVLAAGLADYERWPELNNESSPDPSDDDEPGKRPIVRRVRSGYPGGSTSLKHTQTIMGNRSGALGMRVSGKRSSTIGEAIIPMRPSESNLGRVRADSEPTPLPTTPSSPSEPATPGSPDTYNGAHISVSKRRSAGGSSLSEVAASILVKSETPVQASQQDNAAPKLHAMPSFSKIADMQARRTRRRAHFSSAGNTGRHVMTSQRPMNSEMSSSDEGAGLSGSMVDDDGFDRLSEQGDGMEGDMEEFDPDFAPARIGANSDISEADSSVSHQIAMAGLSLEGLQPPSLSGMQRIPSPIEEDGREYQDHRRSRGSRSSTEHSDSTAQIPPSKPDPKKDRDPDLTRQQAALSARRRTRRMTLLNNKAPPQESGLFTRLKTLPPRQTTSALTSKLAATSTSTNPFTETYALISGRAEVASMTIQVFFPHARSPVGKPLELTVRKDATIEEVIGFALWSYWEENWSPKLDEGLEGADEAKKKARFSAAGWVLRIAEDDGEVDEDFPAPDRMGKISKFNFDAYAILEATTAQVAQNTQLESKIVRRPSRIIVAKKKAEPTPTLAPAPSMGPSSSALFPSALGSSLGIPASLSLSSSHGPQVLLRIALDDAATDVVHYSTTISVSATMYMQEVLEHVCRKWKIEDTKEWALLTPDHKILVPLDRTVASLEGSTELVLVRRASLPQYGFAVDGDKRYGRSTDPNASIKNLNRISEVPGRANLKYTETGMQVIASYKRYTVYRKVPMLVGRLVRTLAIDGDYIHIMPSANKAKGVFDSGKTYSYHIKSVLTVHGLKTSANFKLVFRRDMGDKRYDFEAESVQAANEIVSTIKGLKQSLDRSSTVSKQRRSRHWKEP